MYQGSKSSFDKSQRNLLLEEKNDCRLFLKTMPLKLILMFWVTSTHSHGQDKLAWKWLENSLLLSPVWTRTKLRSKLENEAASRKFDGPQHGSSKAGWILGYFGREPSLPPRPIPWAESAAASRNLGASRSSIAPGKKRTLTRIFHPGSWNLPPLVSASQPEPIPRRRKMPNAYTPAKIQ